MQRKTRYLLSVIPNHSEHTSTRLLHSRMSRTSDLRTRGSHWRDHYSACHHASSENNLNPGFLGNLDLRRHLWAFGERQALCVFFNCLLGEAFLKLFPSLSGSRLLVVFLAAPFSSRFLPCLVHARKYRLASRISINARGERLRVPPGLSLGRIHSRGLSS